MYMSEDKPRALPSEYLEGLGLKDSQEYPVAYYYLKKNEKGIFYWYPRGAGVFYYEGDLNHTELCKCLNSISELVSREIGLYELDEGEHRTSAIKKLRDRGLSLSAAMRMTEGKDISRPTCLVVKGGPLDGYAVIDNKATLPKECATILNLCVEEELVFPSDKDWLIEVGYWRYELAIRLKYEVHSNGWWLLYHPLSSKYELSKDLPAGYIPRIRVRDEKSDHTRDIVKCLMEAFNKGKEWGTHSMGEIMKDKIDELLERFH